MARPHEILYLNDGDREALESMLAKGIFNANQFKRSEILLKSEFLTVSEIAMEVGRSESTVRNIRKKYIEGDLHQALYDRPRPGAPKKIYSEHEAMITTLACSEPPEGRSCWTLELLADRVVQLTDLESIGKETVRRVLKKVT